MASWRRPSRRLSRPRLLVSPLNPCRRMRARLLLDAGPKNVTLEVAFMAGALGVTAPAGLPNPLKIYAPSTPTDSVTVNGAPAVAVRSGDYLTISAGVPTPRGLRVKNESGS